MRAIIFDTETTGLLMPSKAPLEKQPRIIELGALAVSKDGIIGELSQLLNPGIEISAEITKITGITNADLVGKPTFEEYLPQLADFFRGADFLICHNAPFDTGMLRNDLKRAGCDDFPWPTEILCTVQEYHSLFGHRPSLKVLYERIIGAPLSQTHRALDDAAAVHAVLLKDKFFDKIGVLT
jgi:DNA polymerase III epsilon subunit family exonuclease